jgi:hypothetical protein
MILDSQTVKERISLVDLFQRDGHQLKKEGSAWVCHCPLHEEKIASCQIHEEERYFKCYGCDFKGDAFVYWQRTRKVDFETALEALTEIAGISGPAPVLYAERREEWREACERLQNDQSEIERIAKRRGYSVATVKWMAEMRLMGLLDYMGAQREAFLVERPDHDGDGLTPSRGLIPLGWQIHLEPASPGNDHPRKASWRYPWAGIGAWPFVVGSLATAEEVIFIEGQWDALALIDVMDWTGANGLKYPIAVVGLCGATSWSLFLKHYTWPVEMVAFLIGDPEQTKFWASKGGFFDQLSPRCARVQTFCTRDGYDFSDLHKAGQIEQWALREMFMSLMLRPERLNVGGTFLRWCKAQAPIRNDEIGKAAYLVAKDKNRPKGSATRSRMAWERHWAKEFAEHLPSLRAAWEEWAASCRLIRDRMTPRM